MSMFGMFKSSVHEARAKREREASKLPIRARGDTATDRALDAVQKALDEKRMPRAVRFVEPEKPRRTQADIIRSLGQDTGHAYFTQAKHVGDQMIRLAEELETKARKLRERADVVFERISQHATDYAKEVSAQYDRLADAEDAIEQLARRFPPPPRMVEAATENVSQETDSQNAPSSEPSGS